MKKVVVAYSGGLDTSYAVMYLAREKGYEVHAVSADTGGFSKAQLKANEENAYKLGAKHFAVIDITQEYYEKSYTIDEELTKETAALGLRRNLSISCEKLGDVAKARGDLAQAQEYYERCHTIDEELAKEIIEGKIPDADRKPAGS